jgi:hypothetical protein
MRIRLMKIAVRRPVRCIGFRALQPLSGGPMWCVLHYTVLSAELERDRYAQNLVWKLLLDYQIGFHLNGTGWYCTRWR